MKNVLFGLIATLAVPGIAIADNFELDHTMLRNGTVSSKQNCVSIHSGFSVRATTPNGRLTTYTTNNQGDGHGIYVGAPSSPPYTTANSTAAPEGTYELSFEPAISSLSMTLDWLTNLHEPAEKLWAFATDRGAIRVKFKPAGNSATFDGKSILASSVRGAGVLTYSGKPFKTFKFKHRQHPRNIGFTIKNIKVSTASRTCR